MRAVLGKKKLIEKSSKSFFFHRPWLRWQIIPSLSSESSTSAKPKKKRKLLKKDAFLVVNSGPVFQTLDQYADETALGGSISGPAAAESADFPAAAASDCESQQSHRKQQSKRRHIP
jgi:hypothetical protein